jgi:hypothetical protein
MFRASVVSVDGAPLPTKDSQKRGLPQKRTTVQGYTAMQASKMGKCDLLPLNEHRCLEW